MAKHIVLVHGTWCTGSVWGQFATELENLGFTVHTPSLRYHDLPYEEVMEKVGDVSLTEYVDDITALVESLDEAPILLGHSLGGLIVQLVAERVPIKGLILMGPAPTGDIFAFYPTMVKCFIKHFARWGFWKKPMPPYKKAFFKYCMNQQEEADKEIVFKDLVPESGLVYTQMAFPFLDRKRSTFVNYQKVDCPVLTITGSEDKMVNPAIARNTAKHYQDSILVSITGSDHMYEYGKYRQTTIRIIDGWLSQKGLK